MQIDFALKLILMIALCLILEPADRPPVLLIANSETIEVLDINGGKALNRSSINANGMHTLDFFYDENTVCWIESKKSSYQLKCHKITKTWTFTEDKTIHVSQYLHSK